MNEPPEVHKIQRNYHLSDDTNGTKQNFCKRNTAQFSKIEFEYAVVEFFYSENDQRHSNYLEIDGVCVFDGVHELFDM